MSTTPDPVVRECHSNTCTRSFLYEPHPAAIEAGLSDKVDAMATAREGWTRVTDDEGRTVHYCARCARDALPSGTQGR